MLNKLQQISRLPKKDYLSLDYSQKKKVSTDRRRFQNNKEVLKKFDFHNADHISNLTLIFSSKLFKVS